MNETRDPAAVRFGPFLYEPLNGRLLRAGAELGVPPRALAILGCLIERPGLLVTKQALLDRVWKDAFVTDTSLSEAVSVLRQALGDDAQEPNYVQMVLRTALLPALGRVTSDDAIAATGGTLVRTPPCRTCDAVVLRTETGDALPILVPGTGVDAWRLTADDTQVLVIARHGEHRHVWRIAVADGTRTLLERGPAFAIASDATGMSVVLASQQEGRWTIRAPDSPRPLATASVPLVPTAVTNDVAAWFHREGAAGSLDVWTVGPDAAANAVVAPPHNEWDAQPSPDGTQVAFVSDARGEPEIVVRDVTSGEALATWPGAQARWRADGAALLVREGRRRQAVAWDPARHRLVHTGMPPQLPLPAAATPATELDVVLQWARDVRQQVPVAPRPLPVVR